MFWFIGRQRSWQNHFLQVKQYCDAPNKRAHLHAYFPLHSLIFDPKHAGVSRNSYLQVNKFKKHRSKDPEVRQCIVVFLNIYKEADFVVLKFALSTWIFLPVLIVMVVYQLSPFRNSLDFERSFKNDYFSEEVYLSFYPTAVHSEIIQEMIEWGPLHYRLISE